MKNRKNFVGCLLLVALLAGCATTGPSGPPSAQEKIVVAYEQIGVAARLLQPILAVLERDKFIQGNDLANAKKFYAQAGDVYFHAGDALQILLSGDPSQGTTYLSLIQTLPALLISVGNQIPADEDVRKYIDLAAVAVAAVQMIPEVQALLNQQIGNLPPISAEMQKSLAGRVAAARTAFPTWP